MRLLWVWLGLLLCCSFSLPAAAADTLQPALEPLVRDFLKAPGVHSPGLQVGLVMPGKRALYSWGHIDRHTAQAPRPEHIYEIASLSKPITAILVADAVQRREIALDSAIMPCQPEEHSTWCYRRQGISWRDLLTHHSGLPALPDNLNADLPQPLRQYTPEQLSDFLRRFRRTVPSGKGFAYSNLGYSLLGQALAHKAGLSFDALVRRRFS
ncbi:MAG: beta-lactamase family protein [Candidatus Sericytochromatia bacterium]|nr:beta-lactamase family protein [Candidatus Sericytochromatia bacterium]